MGLREWALPLSFLFACSAGCSFPACSGSFFLTCSWGSFLACFPMVLPSGRLLSLLVLVAVPAFHGLLRRPRPAVSLPLRRPCQQHLPDGSSLQRPCRQRLPDGSSLQRPCRQSSVPTVPCLQQLRHSASAGNKPHPAEKHSGLASNLAHLGRIC